MSAIGQPEAAAPQTAASDEDAAATKLQASVRGRAARREVQGKKGSDFFRRQLEDEEKALGPRHPLTLAKLNKLAVVVRDQDGRRFEAESLFRRLLEGQEEALGPKHPDTLLTVDNLIDLIIDQEGKLDEAEALCRRLLDAKQEALGPKDPDTLNAIVALGCALGRQGKLDEEIGRAHV